MATTVGELMVALEAIEEIKKLEAEQMCLHSKHRDVLFAIEGASPGSMKRRGLGRVDAFLEKEVDRLDTQIDELKARVV